MQELIAACEFIVRACLGFVDEEEPACCPLRRRQGRRLASCEVSAGIVGEQDRQVTVELGFGHSLPAPGEHGDRGDREALQFAFG